MKREINSMFDEGRIGAEVSEKLLGRRFAIKLKLFRPEPISPDNKVVFGHVESIDGRRLESQKKRNKF